MNYQSTNGSSPAVSLQQAVLNGLAPDGGLYMPSEIPHVSPEFIGAMDSLSFQDIAYIFGAPYFLDSVPGFEYRRIVDESFNFDVPLVQLDRDSWVLELFHGPTLAFKDFAARFMARLMAHYAQEFDQRITVLVATSGDTGSAVAHGFLGVDKIDVVILYPSGRVSVMQEKQLTTMGQNITALEVQGSFDDCQAMVKTAFLDPELAQRMKLASANSINIARLLPQMFYYIFLCSRLRPQWMPITVSVPSGNLGNLTAGLMAKRMGAPIQHFIAANNNNDTLAQYLRTGVFHPKPSVSTVSNAMDVGNPSNFARMQALYNNDVEAMRHDVIGYSFTDGQTTRAIATTYKQYGYIMDPHGAVGYLALQEYQQMHSSCTGVIVETAHPAKFADVVEPAIGQTVPMPDRLGAYAARAKQSIVIGNTFEDLKTFLTSKH
ncbi:threonine synthase [Candidatus Uhrbacteria bacterium]|nr:threonine synthase [Candidatus Uhrbacteria bacterium]